MKRFIPFNKIGSQQVIVVDGLHPHNLCLSHWKGANNITSIAADTSGEIVLNALENSLRGIDCNNITATHFDIDGFVGVFALFYPKLALQYKSELIAMARIGDFREFRPKNSVDDFALKLCCWMNKVEREKFYRPFESKDEIELCVEKFNYFLSTFSNVLENIKDYRLDWETEYQQVIAGLEDELSLEVFSEIGLTVKHYSKPAHYYSLFSNTEGTDIIMSIYPNNRYELELKYTTWIDLASRLCLPRINLTPLVKQLNVLETSSYTWNANNITDTGPILRLASEKISKADQYDHPFERKIHSSSISPIDFKNYVLTYFKLEFKNISPKKYWTWSDMKSLKH